MSMKIKKETFVNEIMMNDAKSEKILKSKSRKCFFPGCNRCAVKSHTISKGNSLKSIAKDGVVFCFNPRIIDKAHNLESEYVGIRDASSFHGYCSEHEKLFNDIDLGIFMTEYDLMVQLFRCIGRWLFLEQEREKQIKKHQQALVNLKKEILDTLKIPQNIYNIPKYDSGIGEIVSMYSDLAHLVNTDAKRFKQHMIDNKSVIQLGKWTVLYKHLDYQIPLALSSRHPFKLKSDIFSIIWTVVPQKDVTDIMIMLDADGINNHIGIGVVEREWERRIKSPILLIETVEAAMVSTEYWYMNPEVYDRLSEEKKENLQYDVKFKCIYSPVWEPVEYTIFEDIWEKIILQEKTLEIVKAARTKMNLNPKKLTEEEWEIAENKLADKLFNIFQKGF